MKVFIVMISIIVVFVFILAIAKKLIKSRGKQDSSIPPDDRYPLW